MSINLFHQTNQNVETSEEIPSSNLLNNPISAIYNLYQKTKRGITQSIKRSYYQLRKRKPEIQQFECTTPYIVEGGFLQLRWQVTNAYKIEILGIGDVTNLAFLNLIANLSQKTFTLTAYGYETSISETITVHIVPFKRKTPSIKVKPIETAKLEKSIKHLQSVQVKAPNVSIKPIDIVIKPKTMHINQAKISIRTNTPTVRVQTDAISMHVKVPMIDQAKIDRIKEINDSVQLDLLLANSEIL